MSARGSLEPVRHRVLLAFDGHVVTLIDETVVRSSAPRTLAFRAFPSMPSTRPVSPELLGNLEALTTVQEPYNEILRRNLFGPSVVTLLTQRLTPRPPVEAPWPTTERTLAVAERFVLSGAVPTSTITRRPVLPDRLVGTMRAEQVELDPRTESDLVGLLNRGWFVELSILVDTRPNPDQLARIAPERTEFASARANYPVQMAESIAGQPFRFFVLTSSASAPLSYEMLWDERPWDAGLEPPARDTLRTALSQPLDALPEVRFEVTERESLRLPHQTWVARADFDGTSKARADFELVPVPRPVRLPASGARGSWIDLLFCTILGLTPLLYTPESWFVLWLVGRARARARREGRAVGIRLWSFWALAVGLYWFAVLPAGARIAGLLPMLVGMVQLSLPFTEREASPLRIQFRKKPAKKK